MAVATFMSVAAWAQNIAVVSPGNSTSIYQTLDDAIAGAAPGSTIYLPGGGFQISDATQIDKKLTIMGVSHRGDTDNVDGATVISGNLNYAKGSSGSAVLGVYVSGNINVGTEADSVLNLTVRYCNANSIQVRHRQSSGMVVNQCYLRNPSNFAYCNVRLENNIVHSLGYISGGVINHNVITSRGWFTGIGPTDRYGSYYCNYSLGGVNASFITNNFILQEPANYYSAHNGSECQISNNCINPGSWGNDPIVLDDGITWDDVFYENKGVSIYSDYRLKGSWGKNAATDGTNIGIYGNIAYKKDYAPIPRIVSKKVDEQTDGSGKLKVEVKVKAN